VRIHTNDKLVNRGVCNIIVLRVFNWKLERLRLLQRGRAVCACVSMSREAAVWLMWTVRHLRLETCCEADLPRSGPAAVGSRRDCVTSYRCLPSTMSLAAADAKWRHDVTDRAAVLSHMPPTASRLSCALFASHPRRCSAAEAQRQVMTHDNDMSAAFSADRGQTDDRFQLNHFHVFAVSNNSRRRRIAEAALLKC